MLPVSGERALSAPQAPVQGGEPLALVEQQAGRAAFGVGLAPPRAVSIYVATSGEPGCPTCCHGCSCLYAQHRAGQQTRTYCVKQHWCQR